MICKLKPSYKNYLWGGQKLKKYYGKKYDGDVLAESWELSCHPNGLSYIASENREEQDLRSVLKQHPEWVSPKQQADGELPILIKFIDAAQPLSVQVHPDEEYARTQENQHGKNEMWYVLDAEEGAFLYYGFKKNITKKEFQDAVAKETLCDLLRKIPVKKGDVFFIEAGTVHAIGAGMTVAEVQQSSDVTYRVYDFGRKDSYGNARPLHLEKAGDVVRLKPARMDYDFGLHCVTCPWFCVDVIRLHKKVTLKADFDSFHSIICLDGKAVLKKGEEEWRLRKGDSIFVSAGEGDYSIEGNCEILKTVLNSLEGE